MLKFKSLFALAGIILLSSACAGKINPYASVITVGKKTIYVQIVTAPAEMSQGLSGRQALNPDQGMLFDFKSSQRPGFWMKEMNFDLDFIWISQNKIIGITQNVPRPAAADSNLPVYYPPGNVDMVLEVNSGWAEKNGVKVGDFVALKNK